MISRFTAVLVLTGIAGLGYLGATRLGRWLDDPVGDPPRRGDSPADPWDNGRTGWRRWTAQEFTNS